MLKYKMAIGMFVIAMTLLGTTTANAQWVFVARKALGVIEQMTQPDTDDKPGYDVATVVIEGNVDKVYDTAVKSIEAVPKLRITRKNPVQHTIDFTDGTRAAGMKISQVNDTVVHLMIASVTMPGQTSETSIVLAGVVRVCKEMGATYSIAK